MRKNYSRSPISRNQGQFFEVPFVFADNELGTFPFVYTWPGLGWIWLLPKRLCLRWSNFGGLGLLCCTLNRSKRWTIPEPIDAFWLILTVGAPSDEATSRLPSKRLPQKKPRASQRNVGGTSRSLLVGIRILLRFICQLLLQTLSKPLVLTLLRFVSRQRHHFTDTSCHLWWTKQY